MTERMKMTLRKYAAVDEGSRKAYKRSYIKLVYSLLNCECHYTLEEGREKRYMYHYTRSTMLFMKSAQKYWLFACQEIWYSCTANACTSNAPAPYVSAQNDMTKGRSSDEICAERVLNIFLQCPLCTNDELDVTDEYELIIGL